jgi:hypothetical protein
MIGPGQYEIFTVVESILGDLSFGRFAAGRKAGPVRVTQPSACSAIGRSMTLDQQQQRSNKVASVPAGQIDAEAQVCRP